MQKPLHPTRRKAAQTQTHCTGALSTPRTHSLHLADIADRAQTPLMPKRLVGALAPLIRAGRASGRRIVVHFHADLRLWAGHKMSVLLAGDAGLLLVELGVAAVEEREGGLALCRVGGVRGRHGIVAAAPWVRVRRLAAAAADADCPEERCGRGQHHRQPVYRLHPHAQVQLDVVGLQHGVEGGDDGAEERGRRGRRQDREQRGCRGHERRQAAAPAAAGGEDADHDARGCRPERQRVRDEQPLADLVVHLQAVCELRR